MPEFGTPFNVLANDGKLTHAELVCPIRFMVAAKYETVQLYLQLADSIDDELAIEVLKEIAEEERVHTSGFLRLLRYVEPDEERFYAGGTEEVEAFIKRLKKQ
jgi:rubrerythrin